MFLPMAADRLVAAIAGPGFIGPVHLRTARLAGAEVVGVSEGTRRARGAAAAELDTAGVFHSPQGLPTLPTIHDGLRAASIAEAALASARSQAWEDVVP